MNWKRWGLCPTCGKEFRLNWNGFVRPHGHPAARCKGSGQAPSETTREERT